MMYALPHHSTLTMTHLLRNTPNETRCALPPSVTTVTVFLVEAPSGTAPTRRESSCVPETGI